MAEPKTQQNNASVKDFLNSVPDKQKREDSLKLLSIFQEITGEAPKMWGTAIVGFGKYHYKSERSRQEGDWPLTGFSPRKQALTLYIMAGLADHKKLLSKLGRHKLSGGSCLYINKLEDVDLEVLRTLVKETYASFKEKNRK